MFFAKKRPSQNLAGFTLVEMLVASAVFVIIIAIVTAIFVLGIGSRREVTKEVSIQQEAQRIMEIMSRKVRKNLIDYKAYGGTTAWPGSNNFLALKDPESIMYALDNNILTMNGNPMTMAEVKIKNLSFYIYPSQDPFDPVNPQNIQPRVTIVMKIGLGEKKMILQQTIPQRFTERR